MKISSRVGMAIRIVNVQVSLNQELPINPVEICRALDGVCNRRFRFEILSTPGAIAGVVLVLTVTAGLETVCRTSCRVPYNMAFPLIDQDQTGRKVSSNLMHLVCTMMMVSLRRVLLANRSFTIWVLTGSRELNGSSMMITCG